MREVRLGEQVDWKSTFTKEWLVRIRYQAPALSAPGMSLQPDSRWDYSWWKVCQVEVTKRKGRGVWGVGFAGLS